MKKLQYVLSPEALQDLRALFLFLSQNHEEEVFFEIRQKINKTIDLLREFPEIGKENSFGLRIYPIKNTKYVVIFRIEKNTLEIIRIFHTSQKWEV